MMASMKFTDLGVAKIAAETDNSVDAGAVVVTATEVAVDSEVKDEVDRWDADAAEVEEVVSGAEVASMQLRHDSVSICCPSASHSSPRS